MGIDSGTKCQIRLVEYNVYISNCRYRRKPGDKSFNDQGMKQWTELRHLQSLESPCIKRHCLIVGNPRNNRLETRVDIVIKVEVAAVDPLIKYLEKNENISLFVFADSETKSYKLSYGSGHCDRRSLSGYWRYSWSFSSESFCVIQLVNAEFETTIDTCSYRLADWSRHDDNYVARHIDNWKGLSWSSSSRKFLTDETQ